MHLYIYIYTSLSIYTSIYIYECLCVCVCVHVYVCVCGSSGEAAILELYWAVPSMLLLPDPPWLVVVVPVRVSSMSQIYLFEIMNCLLFDVCKDAFFVLYIIGHHNWPSIKKKKTRVNMIKTNQPTNQPTNILLKPTFKKFKGTNSFPGLLHFTFDTYFIMLSVKQGPSSTIFESLVWRDLGLNTGLSDHWLTLYPLCMFYWRPQSIFFLGSISEKAQFFFYFPYVWVLVVKKVPLALSTISLDVVRGCVCRCELRWFLIWKKKSPKILK